MQIPIVVLEDGDVLVMSYGVDDDTLDQMLRELGELGVDVDVEQIPCG